MKNKNLFYLVISIVAIMLITAGFLLARERKESPLVEDGVVTTSPTPTPVPGKMYQFIEIVDACDWTYVGTCVNMRKGAGKQYGVAARLRNGVVLKVGGTKEVNGVTWYKIAFGLELRYPERVEGDLYVAAGESVRLFEDEGELNTTKLNKETKKKIVVDVSEQTLYAYEGDELYMKEPISTGLEFTPTPRGKFFILRKTPARYMQGPIEGVSDQYYDLPGVPWDLYFTRNGDVIHGAYWHDKFGEPWSHGCVNLPVEQAMKLYKWAEVGVPVTVKE